MYTAALDGIDGNQIQYRVRVRPSSAAKPTQCIWGSAGLLQDITFPKPLILHVSNDRCGQAVTLGTQVVSTANPPGAPTQTTIGTLQPGECVSIPVQGFSGVFATCAVETTVYCLIRTSP